MQLHLFHSVAQFQIQDEVRKDAFNDCRNFQLVEEHLYPRAGCFRHDFLTNDLKILESPTSLNDTCLNGCANILQETYPSELSCRCAILSTHDLVRIRYNVDDDNLWRSFKRTSYWLKEVWILPIHRTGPPGHWVLAIIYLRTHDIHLFDSFADQNGWEQDVKVRIIMYIAPSV